MKPSTVAAAPSVAAGGKSGASAPEARGPLDPAPPDREVARGTVWSWRPFARLGVLAATLLRAGANPFERVTPRPIAPRRPRHQVSSPPAATATAATAAGRPSGGSGRGDRADAVFAVAGQRLWHPVEGRCGGADRGRGGARRPRAQERSGRWRGARGPTSGRVIVLRAGAGDDLSVAMDFLTAEDHDPAALAAPSDHEFYIGGANPGLVRARLYAAPQMNDLLPSRPRSTRSPMPDAMMALRFRGGGVGMFRWGETMAVERPGVPLLVLGLALES